ncbi:hypothetical protein BM524_18215 [Alteromonas mediterranea]|uniref:Tyr recombinase domain-containing protein n=1 Tax=Alteromonas mediterranea TaxID=314275 RepID=A0AAC9JCY2_9ALTE|nr:tyrosine-type recombinase/integrase [Alteromonas mediterranea]APD91574.1 hypothetical protein BM524_18215 [Alteromonas mediterranea]
MAKLTFKQVLASLDADLPLTQKSYSDGSGLVIALTSGVAGVKAEFITRYDENGKRNKRKIGEYPAMSLIEAQALNSHIQEEMARGFSAKLAIDTFQKTPVANTVSELFEAYKMHHLIPNLKSAKKVIGIFNNHILPVIGNMKAIEVGVPHAYALINSARSDGVKGAILTCLRQLNEFGYQFKIIDHNVFRELSRKRFRLKPSRGSKTLSALELHLFFTACEKHNIKRVDLLAMVLYMTLAVRKCELLDAPWSEFNLGDGVWHLPPERTKEEQGISIPLAPQVINWLKELKSYNPSSKYLFPARKRSSSPTLHESTLNRSLASVFTELNINIHGHRHLAYTLMESLHIPKHIRDVCLNHRDGDGDADTYSHWLFFDERKEAHQKLVNLVSKYVPESI